MSIENLAKLSNLGVRTVNIDFFYKDNIKIDCVLHKFYKTLGHNN